MERTFEISPISLKNVDFERVIHALEKSFDRFANFLPKELERDPLSMEECLTKRLEKKV
jgi:hypothetical protein